MKISWQIVRHELSSPFGISKGTYSYRNALIVQLHENGHSGFGEATEVSYYGIRIGRFIDLLQDQLRALSEIPLHNPDQYYQELTPFLQSEPFLLSAFDCAAYDLFGKLNGVRIVDWLKHPLPETLPNTSYTIGLDKIPIMQEKIRKKKWPLYKIKLDGQDDLNLIQQLRQVTEAPFLVDANEAWSVEQTEKLTQQFAELNVIAIEQPVHRDCDEELWQLIERPIPFIADESCQIEEDVRKCAQNYDGINIKLMKCGGLTPARRMIKEARALGLKVMLGCMTESSIGISAAAQIIPQADFIDLDGAMLLKKDISTGVTFEDGQVTYSQDNGFGCQLFETSYR